jgi:hypothetical protein
MPFIDFYMVQLTYAAGLPWRRLPHAVCCSHAKVLKRLVRNEGLTILHSVKTPEDAQAMMEARRQYLAGHK